MGPTKSCHIIGSGNNSQAKLSAARYDSASIVVNATKLWMTGGTTLSGPLQTTEFIELDAEGENGISIPGPSLPLPFFRHCRVALTESIYLYDCR